MTATLPGWEPDRQEETSPVCPTGTILASAAGTYQLFPARCKKWSCDPCGKKKARELANRIARARAYSFLTLTYRADPDISPQLALDRLNDAWRKLWKRWKREYGAACKGYVKIVELQRNGTPHLHLALRAPFIPQAHISAAWAELTGSPIVDIRVVKTKSGIARYLAKYLTKARERVASRRRWSQSKQFLPQQEKRNPEPDDAPVSYSFHRPDLDTLHYNLLQDGYVLLGRYYIRASILDPSLDSA